MLRLIPFRPILVNKFKELCNNNLLMASPHCFSNAYMSCHVDGSRSLPRLMDFPEILWPSTINTLKNWFLIQFIIRPYFEKDFTIRDFVFGAKHALQRI
ncbi:uncharacterized protein LOC118744111 [Rhagoletis pomonella]|uniref:uncharacterized protein LOC118744111 n=1 Tax=Rhagoletis pomonella TaxID=28610 RepID=UPI00177BD101|nr:uncharacterized protein LOC118744111 [Rhagoletis pomonella]